MVSQAKYVVTFAQFEQYCDEMGIDVPNDEKFGKGRYVLIVFYYIQTLILAFCLIRHPVINITWLDATKYCNWLSRKADLKEAFSDDVCILNLGYLSLESP